MSMVWKLLIALGLLLPSGAFMAGMLVASTAEPQAPRETILIRDSEPGPDSSTRSPNRRPERSSTPSPSLSPTGGGVADPDADDGDDGRVEVITPDPADMAAMVARHGPNLFHKDPALRRLCCHVRKVAPLDRALAGVEAWSTGLRRDGGLGDP